MARASHATSFPRRVRPASASRTGWPPGFALSPRRRRQAVAARRCVGLIVPEYEALGLVRKMSALERVADRRSRARSTTMLPRTMRSQRDAGESLVSEFAIGAGRFVARRKRDSEVRVAAWVLISAAPQARRADRPREQARCGHPGVDERFAPARAAPPRRRVCARQAASRTSPAKTRGPLTSSSRRPARDKCAMSREGLCERRRRRGPKGPRPVSSLSVASLEAFGLWCRRVAPEPRCPPRGGRASCSRIDRASSSGRAWRAAIRSSRVGSPAPLRTGR